MGKVLKIVAVIAIAAAVAYFAPQIAGLILASTASAAAVAATTAAVAAVLSVAATTAFSAIIGKPSVASTATPGIFRQALTNSFIVYGKRRVGGLLIFFHPRTVGKDQYRYFVVAVAGHRSKGVVQWLLGDTVVTVDGSGLVTSGTYAGNAWLWLARGTDDQAAHPTFVAETDGKWTANHRGRGTTLIYAKFKMVDAVVQAGMPNITVELEGKDDILDVRTGQRGYTRNSQLIFRDFMALPREEGGFGCYPDELDDDWDAAQANVCDEQVPLAAGGSEPRYAFDSYITTGAAPSEIRDTMVTCCAGTFTYSGGKMLMRPGYYVPVSATLSEDDLAGAISVPALLSGDRIANEVTGTYINPAAMYQPADAPTRSIDSNDVRQIAIDMPHVTSGTMAQRVMEIALRKAQAERRVTWPMNIMGLAVSTLDTVQAATSRYGLSNYAFQVVGWGLSQDFSVVLQLEETSPDIFHWSTSMELTAGRNASLTQATPIDDRPSRAAHQIAGTDNASPTSATVDKITITASNVTLDDGSRVALPAGQVAGLAASTSYVVLWSLSAQSYSAAVMPALDAIADGDKVILQYQATPAADGSYPAQPNPAPGSGGGGYGGGGRYQQAVQQQ